MKQIFRSLQHNTSQCTPETIENLKTASVITGNVMRVQPSFGVPQAPYQHPRARPPFRGGFHGGFRGGYRNHNPGWFQQSNPGYQPRSIGPTR